MNTHNITKEERIRLVLDGILSLDYITLQEVEDLLRDMDELVLLKLQTHNMIGGLQ